MTLMRLQGLYLNISEIPFVAVSDLPEPTCVPTLLRPYPYDHTIMRSLDCKKYRGQS